MQKYFLFFVLSGWMFACTAQQSRLVKQKKWMMYQEVVRSQDKKTDTTYIKTKDFSVIDRLYFNTADKLAIVSYGDSSLYDYKIQDSVLSFWPSNNTGKIQQYLICTATSDSLVLKRVEVWGGNVALKLTGMYHLSAVKE